MSTAIRCSRVLCDTDLRQVLKSIVYELVRRTVLSSPLYPMPSWSSPSSSAYYLLFGNVETVTNTKTNFPMIEVYYLTTKSVAATNIFIVAIFLIILITVFNTFASVSRLTWAFARDKRPSFFEHLRPVELEKNCREMKV